MKTREKTVGRFLVRAVPAGGELSNGHVNDAGATLVEVLDTENAHPEFCPRGQFVSRYYLTTLLEHPAGAGLNLHGGVPVWTIPSSDMDELAHWFRGILLPRRSSSLADSFSRRRGGLGGTA